MKSFELIGQFDCTSTADQPYKPHIPHPHFVRLVGVGEVDLVAEPSNPEDGEQVIAVEKVRLDEAVRRFEAEDRQDIAELYKLADAYRRGTDIG
ncbi:MAG TPA: hypothetical protein VFK44_04685 [Bacillales bacterium]|nr:hypothetical protein [Bacillales bacterium]